MGLSTRIVTDCSVVTVILFTCGERSQTGLRRTRLAFPNFQLLSAPGTAHCQALRSVSAESRASAQTVSVRALGFRRHAGTRSLASKRTSTGDAVDCRPGIETQLRPEVGEKRGSHVSQNRRDMGHPRFLFAAFLAGAILRFQCLDGEEANREASIHPSESGEARIGDFPGTVALEQLSLLPVR